MANGIKNGGIFGHGPIRRIKEGISGLVFDLDDGCTCGKLTWLTGFEEQQQADHQIRSGYDFNNHQQSLLAFHFGIITLLT